MPLPAGASPPLGEARGRDEVGETAGEEGSGEGAGEQPEAPGLEPAAGVYAEGLRVTVSSPAPGLQVSC